MVHRCVVVVLLIAGLAVASSGQTGPVRIISPNSQIELTLSTGAVGPDRIESVRYSVTFHGKPVIADSQMGLELQGQPALLGPGMKQTAARSWSSDETYVVPAGKSNPVRNQYNAALVEFMGEGEPAIYSGGRALHVEARVYDDGVAFRYSIPTQMWQTNVRIKSELTKFQFAKDGPSYPLILPGYVSSYEEEYQRRLLSGLQANWLIALPLLVELPGTAWIAVTEADIDNYAGMYLRHVKDSGPLLYAQLAPRLDDQEVAVVAPTPVTSPWRVLMIGSDPGKLIESNIIINLNPPTAIPDMSWIRPGKTMWDWWSGPSAKNVSFQPGVNMATEKHYIDFASEAGFPYMLVDAGWSRRQEHGKPNDITHTSEAIDMAELVRYAGAKKVRLWLWAHWTEVDQQMEVAFPLFERWGIAGVKIDFMDRDDQAMVNWYRRVLQKAAESHLMVDFHGAYKPDGIRRTWPNLLTREGVMGAEYNKWSARETPTHNCTLPFTRMLAGPMDYTPGGFLNVTREEFQPRNTEPMVMGTRAHQLALFVVFESELQMVADFPDRYRGDRDFEFLRKVPATWDETRYIAGSPMEYIALARRSGNEWYVGAITDWNAREIELPLQFLRDGKYRAKIYSDAPDSATQPTRTSLETRIVDRTTTLKLGLVSGGGSAIRITPVK